MGRRKLSDEFTKKMKSIRLTDEQDAQLIEVGNGSRQRGIEFLMFLEKRNYQNPFFLLSLRKEFFEED